MEAGREPREASKSTTYPGDLFRDKWKKRDRELQSPQPFYTFLREPLASNIGGSPRYSCNKADSLHENVVRWGNYIPPHLGHGGANLHWETGR